MNLRPPEAVLDGHEGQSAPQRRASTSTAEDAAAHAADLSGCSDAELLRRMQDRRSGCLRGVLRSLRNPIYRTAYGLTGDRQAAEEVLQDTFARAYRHRHTLLPDVSPLPWLHRVALNLCYSRLSRRRLTTEPIDEIDRGPHPATTAAEPAERAEQAGAPPDRPRGDRRPAREAQQRRRPVLPPRAVAAGDGRRSSMSGSGP